jgi:hypothetical protein
VLLVWEGSSRREEALVMREGKVRIFDQALAQVSTSLNVERAKADAAWQECLDKMEVHTPRGKHILHLDKILAEKKVERDGREQDLVLHHKNVTRRNAAGQNL